MAVGGSFRYGFDAFLSCTPETTYGTKVGTGQSFISFNSESLKLEKDRKVLESIQTSRNFVKRITLNRTVNGTIEAPLNMASDGILYIIKQAMGGTVASAQIAATGSYNHTMYEGNMELTKASGTANDTKSLTFQVRKGGEGNGTGTTWDFTGCRVNSLSIKGEVGDLIYLTAELIGKDASITTSTPTAVYTDVVPANFSGVKVELGASIGAALTEEYFTSFEFTLNNNLKSDAEGRRLGSDSLMMLPVGMREATLKLGTRWDTTTNWTRWSDDTTTAIQLTIIGPSVATAAGSSYSLIIKLPDCFIESTPLPEVGGNDVMMHEINWRAVQQNTTTGYLVQMVATNKTAAYD